PPSIYTLSLHDALPIFAGRGRRRLGWAMRTPRFDGRSVSRRREARVGKEVMDARRSDRYLPGHGVTWNRGKFASLPILAFVREGDRKSTRLNSSHDQIS